MDAERHLQEFVLFRWASIFRFDFLLAQNSAILLDEELESVHVHAPAGIVKSSSWVNGSAGILDVYLCHT